MGFFGKRKNGSHLRTLSEKEIQDKLYGSFRIHEPVQDVMTEVAPAPEPAVQSRESFTSESEPQVPSAPKLTPPARPFTEKKSREDRFSPASEWADEEVESKIKAARLGWEKPSSSGTREFKKPRLEQKESFNNPLQNSLRTAGQSFTQSLNAFFRSVDFRSADLRRLGYFLAGFSFVLFFLFVIHFLNARRETAMKLSRPASRPTAAASASAAEKQASTEKSSPLSPVLPAAVEPPAKIPAANMEGEGNYVIQVCTYAVEPDAKRLLTQFQNEGLTSFVKVLQRAGAKTYYAVFLGRFKTYQAAQKSLADFQKKTIASPFRDAFIRTL